MTETLDGMLESDRHLVSTLCADLLRWLRESGEPTEGVEVLAVCPLLSSGDAPEYGVVLWRDAAGATRLWTAWQYRDLWSAQRALQVLEARAAAYERTARWTRDFVALVRTELALDIVERAPDAPPDTGDEMPRIVRVPGICPATPSSRVRACGRSPSSPTRSPERPTARSTAAIRRCRRARSRPACAGPPRRCCARWSGGGLHDGVGLHGMRRARRR